MTQQENTFVDLAASIVLLLSGTFFLINMGAFVDEGLPAQVSPLVFPGFVTIITLLAAFALLVESLREIMAMRAGKLRGSDLAVALVEADEEEREESNKGFYIYIAILIAYYLVFDTVGFLLTTPLVMFAVSWLLGGRRILMSLCLFIVFTFLLDQAFFRVLKMALPDGILAF